MQQREGHFFTIYQQQVYLHATDLSTFVGTNGCSHVYCYECLSQLKRIERHKQTCQVEEVTIGQPTYCNWAMGTMTMVGCCKPHRSCQEDWFQQHNFAWTRDDQLFVKSTTIVIQDMG